MRGSLHMTSKFFAGAAGAALLVAFASMAHAACPAVTVADDKSVAGAFPQQFELDEFQDLADCSLAFSENPVIAELNARIIGNPATLPPVAERLPDEPLVVAPYERIGAYGGVLDGMSDATEAGTADLLSVRHVNLVRFADDLVTIVPNVAKGWSWNDDFTELTMTLRKGHKWSDGAPFTAEDIAFWYYDLTRNAAVISKPRDLWSTGGEPIVVEVLDEVTVRFSIAVPMPGLLSILATDYAQPFQPRHFLGRFHPDINPDADKLAREAGFESGYEVIAFYYGGSDWKDAPSPLVKDVARLENLPAAVLPTLESHVVVEESAEGRVAVANPYFHMVDTAGNQLPYINEISERFVPDRGARLDRMVGGEIDYKAQSVALGDAPALLDGQEAGGYTVELRPQVGMPTLAFNVTSDDPARRAIFASKRFRQAMSHALDRAEINEVAYLGFGEPRQYIAFDPPPPFATPDQVSFAIDHAPQKARALLNGLGVFDRDGDGLRDLPGGDRLTLHLRYASEGMPTAVAELVASQWTEIGVETTVEEIAAEDYWLTQAANELDVVAWTKGLPIPTLQNTSRLFVPPFDGYVGASTGLLWQLHADTKGEMGVEPPAWTADMAAAILAWQAHLPGTEASDDLGTKLIDLVLDSFVFIGTVSPPAPIYRSNKLMNFATPRTSSYAYYRAYPYRPQQWWLDEPEEEPEEET